MGQGHRSRAEESLTTVTARPAIYLAQSARVRRGSCTGPWLPEPVDTGADPHPRAERAEALDHPWTAAARSHG